MPHHPSSSLKFNAGACPDTPVLGRGDVVAWTVPNLAEPVWCCVDESSHAIYVSLALGESRAGQVAQLDQDGQILARSWCSGLDAPAGLAIHRGRLYVACQSSLLAFRLDSGSLEYDIPIPHARCLGALAVDSAGSVYLADACGNRLFRWDGTAVSTLAEGDDLDHPNGLLVMGNQLFVASQGDAASHKPGRLYALNLKTGQKAPITSVPVGNLGGLTRDERFNFLSVDWEAGKLYLISPKGDVAQLLAGVPGPCAPMFLPGRRWLLMPQAAEGALTAYDLTRLRK